MAQYEERYGVRPVPEPVLFRTCEVPPDVHSEVLVWEWIESGVLAGSSGGVQSGVELRVQSVQPRAREVEGAKKGDRQCVGEPGVGRLEPDGADDGFSGGRLQVRRCEIGMRRQ